MEEGCVGNDYNFQSKGTPTCNDSLSTLKIPMKKTLTTITFASKEASSQKYSMMTKTNTKDSTVNKSTMSMDIS
jgi:hypothetical protein